MRKQPKRTVGVLAAMAFVFAGSITTVQATTEAIQKPTKPVATSANKGLKELSWGDLMPPIDDNIVNQYHEGKLSREQATEYAKSLGETPVKSLHNQRVEIPGYLVPLSMDKHQKAKELLLVPTLGACIHVPPPPPNQTIYVRYDQGIKVTEAGYTPYILKGTLQVEKHSSEYTDTLYALEVESIEEWE